MAIATRFNFVGTPVIPKEGAKRPFFKVTEKTDDKKKKKTMAGMNFGIKESDINMAFVEAFDSVQEKILTMDVDNEKLTVDWEDRFDEDIVAKVANYKKYVVNLGEDFGGRQEFITAYDFMNYLNDNLRNYKGNIRATGQFTKEWYAAQEKYTERFRLQNVYAVDEEVKPRLALVADLYYNKDSVDKSSFKEDKKVYLDAYIEQYIKKDEGKKMIPMQVVFSAAKYKVDENEKHKKLLDYKMSYIDTKSKTFVHIPWDLVLIRGAEEAEFNESMLTARQKEQIELGLKKLEDFKPKGTIIGDRVNEYRLFDPRLDGEFADGLVDTEETPSEFEEKIYCPTKSETLEEAKESSKKAKAVEEAPFDVDDDDDDMDLF